MQRDQSPRASDSENKIKSAKIHFLHQDFFVMIMKEDIRKIFLRVLVGFQVAVAPGT